VDERRVYEAVLRRIDADERGDVYRDAAAEVLGILPEAVTPDQRLEVKRLAWGMCVAAMRSEPPALPPYCHWCSTHHSGERKGQDDGKYCPGPLLEPHPSWSAP
jgi:hypothetical protein